MSRYYVFNGDADGLCALHQLRLVDPTPAELVTGVKRDIKLLDRVQAGAGDRVTVLDVSLNSNRLELMRLLDAGASVEYFDHHYAGEIPRHHNFAAHIDVSAEVCTSILVDRHLQGKYRLWAIVAAFGDNLGQSARILAEAAGLAEAQIEKLAQLGEYLNYNGYGETVEDLHFHPVELYGEIRPYPDPFVFIAESAAFARLAAGFRDDIVMIGSLRPLLEGTSLCGLFATGCTLGEASKRYLCKQTCQRQAISRSCGDYTQPARRLLGQRARVEGESARGGYALHEVRNRGRP